MIRFDVSLEDSAKFATSGALAANKLFELEATQQHCLPIRDAMVEQLTRLADADQPVINVVQLNAGNAAHHAQWWALRTDLTELVADAIDAGTDVLKKMGPQINPKPDLTLKTPDVNDDPAKFLLTAFVMMQKECSIIVKCREYLLKIVERAENASDLEIQQLGASIRAFLANTQDIQDTYDALRQSSS